MTYQRLVEVIRSRLEQSDFNPAVDRLLLRCTRMSHNPGADAL